MRLTLEPASRRPAPLWTVALVVCWLAGVGLVLLLRGADQAPVLCTFRRVTGLPCPTCGTTRAVLALGRADVPAAVAMNPFVVAGLGAATLVWLVRLVLGRRMVVHWTPRERRAVLLALGVVFLVNWAFLIWRETS